MKSLLVAGLVVTSFLAAACRPPQSAEPATGQDASAKQDEGDPKKGRKALQRRVE